MKERVILLLAALMVTIAGGSSFAQPVNLDSNYPSKPIRLIVPFAAGGSTDFIHRTVSNAASKYLNNQQVVVENMPGGATTIGLSTVYTSDPDGYTIGAATMTGLNIVVHTQENLVYDYNGFKEIIKYAYSPHVLLVRKDAPWDTFEQWVDYVKENPGEFKYSTTGSGTIPHLAMVKLAQELNVDIRAVPYEGGGPAMLALLGGNVQGTAAVAGNADLDQTKILVSFSKKREKFDAPTLIEKGINIGVEPFNGVVAPPGVPDQYINILYEAFKKAIEEPEVAKKITDYKVVINVEDPAGFAEDIEEGYQYCKQVLESMGLTK